MFSVIFEVNRKSDHLDEYLDLAKYLKPILVKIDGFVDNARIESLLRKGWLLSHSTWRDEKSVVRWRAEGEHHGVQEKSRFQIFQDYHLGVGEVVSDTAPPANAPVHEPRFDETEAGELNKSGFMGHDVWKSINTEGKLALLYAWQNVRAAKSWTPKMFGGVKEIRHRIVRAVRDYGMYDRREAPQFYPDVVGAQTKHTAPAR